MTAQAPDLTPDELRDARDAWMLSLLGQPIPTMYRPAAAKAAEEARRAIAEAQRAAQQSGMAQPLGRSPYTSGTFTVMRPQ